MLSYVRIRMIHKEYCNPLVLWQMILGKNLLLLHSPGIEEDAKLVISSSILLGKPMFGLEWGPLYVGERQRFTCTYKGTQYRVNIGPPIILSWA